MKRFFNNAWVRSIFFPILAFIGYFAFSILVVFFVPNALLATAVTDACVVIFFFVLWWKYHKLHKDETHKLSLSVVGWTLLLLLFGLIYVFAEYTGNYIAAMYPHAGLTDFYTEMTETEMWTYLIIGWTVGPIAEELLYRFGIFRWVREKFSFWVAYFVSAILFTLSHGTLMHVPVGMIISLFLVILYEYTGMISYCIGFHILFNVLASTYIFSAPISALAAWICYGVLFVILIVVYIFREQLFGKYLHAIGTSRLENYLDNRIKNFADNHPYDKEEK